MSISNLLHEMCADLAEADLNAIRKARGFSPSETASRTSFASYFVSSIGVTEALQNISAEEIITSEPTAHPWRQKALKNRQISLGKKCVKTARYGGRMSVSVSRKDTPSV
jgi:hypothetical protein